MVWKTKQKIRSLRIVIRDFPCVFFLHSHWRLFHLICIFVRQSVNHFIQVSMVKRSNTMKRIKPLKLRLLEHIFCKQTDNKYILEQWHRMDWICKIQAQNESSSFFGEIYFIQFREFQIALWFIYTNVTWLLLLLFVWLRNCQKNSINR